MDVQLNYLDETLISLEEKAQEYLICEEKIRYAQIEEESKNKQAGAESQPETNPEEGGQQMASAQLQQGQPIVKTTETAESLTNLQNRLSGLKAEIIALLPEKNKFITVNLGYGPSSIGAFPNKENPEELDLIIVH